MNFFIRVLAALTKFGLSLENNLIVLYAKILLITLGFIAAATHLEIHKKDPLAQDLWFGNNRTNNVK